MSAQTTRLAQEERTGLLDSAAAFSGRPRERIVALMETEALLRGLQHRRHAVSREVDGPSTGRDRNAAAHDDLRGCEQGLISRLIDVIIDAVHDGDLQFPNEQRPSEMALAACILALGIGMLMDTATTADGVESTAFDPTRDAMDEFLDAQGWRPLTTEWDYAETRKRIRQVIMASEPCEETRGLNAALRFIDAV